MYQPQITITLIKGAMRNLALQLNSCPIIGLAVAFILLTATACEKQEKWLHCQESRGWEDPENKSSFYIKIKRSDEKNLGLYIDRHNTSPAIIKESPVTIKATTNIKRHPRQNGMLQVTYEINKEDLKFSKITRNWISNQFGKPENVGGITISEAGSCKSSKKPS